MDDRMIYPKLIACCNQDAALAMIHVHPHVIISITDPPPWGSVDRLKFRDLDDLLIDVLHLQFGDFHRRHFDTMHEGRSLREWAMNLSHASVVREFLEIHYGKYHTVIVHCAAGVSRSPSMAVAIAEVFGIDKHQIEPVCRNWDAQPLNPWVYGMTREGLKRSEILRGRKHT